MFPDWDYRLIAVSASFHGVAILCTLFRLWYRWHIARVWWDDAWAVLALLADIACLIVTSIEQPIPGDRLPRFFEAGNQVFSFAYPILMWATRLSILASIVRVSRPEGILGHIALGLGTSFGLMAVAMLALRLQLCLVRECLMTKWVLVAQTIMDCTADVLLSVLPIWFLRRMKLSPQRRILLTSAFSATMIINIITIVEAVMLFQSVLTSGSIIFEHVKVACSLIVCNLLVIDTFVYRILQKGKSDLVHSTPLSDRIEFTTIDLDQIDVSHQDTSKGGSSAPTSSSSWSFHSTRCKHPSSVATTAPRIDEELGKRETVHECSRQQ